MPTAFALLNDEPTLDIDSIEPRKKLLAQLREAILMCSPPQVIGVHGDWGSGKTSFLHRLMFEITGECSGNPAALARAEKSGSGQKEVWAKSNAVALWFEAWRYQRDDAPVVALLNEIRAQFSRTRKFGESALKLGEVAVRSALFNLSAITEFIGMPAEKIQKEGEAWERRHRSNPLPSHEVRALLEDAVEKLLKSQDAKLLLIFIDDLDRCSSTSVLRLLEGIKIYLNIKGCVFILGINQHEIERAIARELSKNEYGSEAATVRAQEYLEKLCGHLVRLPLLDQAAQRELLARYLKELAPAELRTAVLDLLADDTGKPQYDFLPPNPRRLKNFANTLLRLVPDNPPLDIAHAARDARAACIVASLHAFQPELHRALQKDAAEFWKVLQEFCQLTFESGALERKDADGYPHALLKRFVRPYGAAANLERIPGPSDPTFNALFTPLFADPCSLDTLFCQQLICDSNLEPADLRPFLNR